ncbi:hypothetical protein PISL3812_08164 [Talaromyces islandicus]|uniref:DNA ligase D 3'-phosphoesterase domain-containing protein n=1 Tax=Talaromyces islandicus TaxID=28573 RepID=A0A0U1M865_TALIS|nr:hypothetical protein PISL3812_08164 [Talaromyces islandicus]
MKRSHSFASDEPNVTNPVTGLASLSAPVSPPRRKFADTQRAQTPVKQHAESEWPSLAVVEAGKVEVDDHVKLFSTRLAQASRPKPPLGTYPRLSIEDWVDLYSRNQNAHGHHFVIHQHDHPVAGPHYDLRLQFSESSSLSWAIMYGLPGDPNSRRINRNATETRVHCLWNHLIETGSAKTGSMIIWDTGEYEILPYYPEAKTQETDDSASDTSHVSSQPGLAPLSESEKLKDAFQNRKIRLRLHGSRLPKNYTISLRLSSQNDNEAREKTITSKRRRRTKRPSTKPKRTPTSRSPSPDIQAAESMPLALASEDGNTEETDEGRSASVSDSESVDAKTRLNNAYPGSTNSVGSIHQRRWFMSLDRPNSGFVQDKTERTWKREEKSGHLLGFDAFYVRGPEAERSIVTGRTGNEVLSDENATGFVPRRGWRPILN